MNFLKTLLRVTIIGGLILMLLISLLMIRGVVTDRTRYRTEAVQRVSDSMAGSQQLLGPLRIVPWTLTQEIETTDTNGRKQTETRSTSGYLAQAPKTLDVDGSLKPDTRRIRLYDVRIYEFQSKLKAAFEPYSVAAMPGLRYGDPYIVIGVEDMRGLVGIPALRLNGQALMMEPGTGDLGGSFNGMHAMLPSTGADATDGQAHMLKLAAQEFELDMNLLGTESLAISPIADSNRIDLRSSWPHPSFLGRFLPNERHIDAGGFTAHWEISSLASNAFAQVAGPAYTRRVSSITGEENLVVLDMAAIQETGHWSMPRLSSVDKINVNLVEPVDVYTQADRATKYGVLFVILTFVAFMLFELIKRLPIHPLQYLLVGLALAIFFLLLLSLSEHMMFWKAYLIAAAACIVLQFFYLSGVLKSWLRAAGFATMLTALYGVLYGLLVSEDNSLLMGSLLLFGVLAAIMALTRKLDWYQITSSLR
ncbi:MAG: cell envelope integrity protein CreD [Xanthomonadaceae bacterium]|jgi:inner membrane protein|nr:cell envelope integrity protein CreD [Xanthomonadaceae bacterium]